MRSFKNTGPILASFWVLKKMRYSCSTVILTTVSLVGTLMSSICGYMALDETLVLFEKYGPGKERGNPALDAPPNYNLDSNTGQQQLLNKDVPGNILPQIFQSIQYFLISIGVFMLVNNIIFFVVISLIQRAFFDFVYNRSITKWGNIRYSLWFSGYAVLLALLWLAMCCFGVLPLVDCIVTIQRCADLENTNYSVKSDICVDLVQYGLIPYRHLPNSGYGKICGENPYEWGNLEGLCENYSHTFNLYILCFVGACITQIAMMLYVVKGVSFYFSFKTLYIPIEEQSEDYKSHSYRQRAMYTPNPYNNFANSVHNPNYENNVLLSDPLLKTSSNIGSYPALPVPPGGDGIEMKKRYYSDAGDHSTSRRSENIVRSSSSSIVPNETQDPSRALSYRSSKLVRHPSTDSMENARPKGFLADVNRQKLNRRPVRQASSELDSDAEVRHGSDVPSEQNRSATAFRPRSAKKRPRSTRSDPDIYRKSNRRAPRKKVPTINEYDSPPSDYYIQEDMQRRSMRLNSRTRSVF